MKALNKIKKTALGMKGNRRFLYIAALVLCIAALLAIMLLIESLHGWGIISGTARAIAYALLSAVISFAPLGLIRGFFRRLDNRGRSLAFLMGLVLAVLLGLQGPLFFLEARGIISAETWNALNPYVIAIATLSVNISCFRLLGSESGDRNREIDDHNREMEERLEQIADHLGEVVELLTEWDARKRD